MIISEFFFKFMVSDFFSISRIYFVVFVQEIWINFLLVKRILGIGREIRI